MYISASLALLLVFLLEACKGHWAHVAPAVSRRWDRKAGLWSLYLSGRRVIPLLWRCKKEHMAGLFVV